MSSLRVITNSELVTHARCQQERYFAYVEGVRSNEEITAFLFGSCWHHGQELWWMGASIGECIEAALVGVSDPYMAVQLRALLNGYDVRWRDETPFSEVLGVEVEFRAPLINPITGAASRTYQRGGKLDVLLRRGFVEHKTTSGPIDGPESDNYWDLKKLDSQISNYFVGAKALGVEPEFCLYDVVRKPRLRPRAIPVLDADGFKQVFDREGNRVYLTPKPRESASKADGFVLQTREETPEEAAAREAAGGKKKQIPILDADGFKVVLDANGERVYLKTKPREAANEDEGHTLLTRPETPDEYESRLVEDIAAYLGTYFQRRDITRSKRELFEYQRDTWHQAKFMREGELIGARPVNHSACDRYGRRCCYFDVCVGRKSLDDPSFVHVDNVHQELSEDA